MINYVFYTIVSLGCAFLVYYLFLKSQKTFQFNRFFLIGSLLLCLLAPVLEIDVFDKMPSITEISLERSEEIVIPLENLKGITVADIQKPDYSILNILWYVYLGISFCFAFRFIKNLFDIVKLTTHSYGCIGKLKLIEVSDNRNASSFFNYLFINPESLNDKHYSESMIQHELVHCNQWHTLDVIVIELLLCAFWFNPFIWFYKKSIVQNHEFIADTYTVEAGIDIENYSQIIISLVHTEHRVPLTSGFNFIQIKNRIIMLHQSKSSVFKRTLKITTALLLFSGVFMLSSFKNLNEPIVVVVDAGHGGEDPGHLNEKDIVLNISKALARYSDKNVKIITLREEDKSMSLNERIKFINAQKPDLLLSLHCNSAANTKASGVEAYYYDNEKTNNESMKYATALIYQQLDENFNDGKMKTANFKILKDINCPGIVLELGFLTNKEDKEKLNSVSHQQDIAKALYKGLLQASKIKL